MVRYQIRVFFAYITLTRVFILRCRLYLNNIYRYIWYQCEQRVMFILPTVFGFDIVKSVAMATIQGQRVTVIFSIIFVILASFSLSMDYIIVNYQWIHVGVTPDLLLKLTQSI